MLKVNLLVRAALCFLFIFLPLQSMDQWFYDRLFRLRGAIHKPTPFVLVRLNPASLFPYFEPDWRRRQELALSPRLETVWHDRFYRSLVTRIRADKPKLIIFASYFGEVEGPVTTPFNQPDILFSAALNEEAKLVPPPSELTTTENYGFSNLFPDSDNIVRRTHLVYSSGASLALRTYHRLNTSPIKRNLIEPLWVDFRGPSASYASYDAADLVEESIAISGRFTDKIVVIGRDGNPATDFETPFGSMSRLEIQANIIDTFLDGREIRILPRYATLLAAGVAVVISIALILAFPLTFAWLLLLLFSGVILLVTLFLFAQFKLWMGIANPVFCIFGTHLVMLGYKLGRQEEQQWKIQQEAETLKEMDRFKNNFISLFSHDLKTPIATIKAVTDRTLTENPELPAHVKDAMKTIDRSNGELARLISDILKVTKMESMPLEPAKEVVDLNRMIETSVSRLRFFADEKQLTIVLDLEPLFSMEGDPQLLQEVIINLLENAIKYSPSSRQILVRTTEEDNRVRVSVRDQGPGIPADEVPRVTGKFYRGRAATDATKGSGLGLYLAKYFVELHQGKLEIQSQVGEGTEVSFWLPING